jgi:hypothetical protein
VKSIIYAPPEDPLIVLDRPVIGPAEKQIGMNVASLDRGWSYVAAGDRFNPGCNPEFSL